jgi:hypothetical protein
MDLPLQIGVAVYHLAKLRMLEFYYDFIDEYGWYFFLQETTDFSIKLQKFSLTGFSTFFPHKLSIMQRFFP